MTDVILSSPLFGIVLSCTAWCVGLWVQKKTRLVLFNPLIVAMAVVILCLVVLGIPYSDYDRGGSFITLMLGPVTAVLALNIYEQRKLLGKYFLPVLSGCLAGSLTSVACALLLCKTLAVEGSIAASLLPKSVTTTIAVAISESSGGIQSRNLAREK